MCSPRSRGSRAFARLPKAEQQFMLPGIRFLFAAVVLTVSLVVFGLGAAALLRSAHRGIRQPAQPAAAADDRVQPASPTPRQRWPCCGSSRARRGWLAEPRRDTPADSARRSLLLPSPNRRRRSVPPRACNTRTGQPTAPIAAPVQPRPSPKHRRQAEAGSQSPDRCAGARSTTARPPARRSRPLPPHAARARRDAQPEHLSRAADDGSDAAPTATLTDDDAETVVEQDRRARRTADRYRAGAAAECAARGRAGQGEAGEESRRRSPSSKSAASRRAPRRRAGCRRRSSSGPVRTAACRASRPLSAHAGPVATGGPFCRPHSDHEPS